MDTYAPFDKVVPFPKRGFNCVPVPYPPEEGEGKEDTSKEPEKK